MKRIIQVISYDHLGKNYKTWEADLIAEDKNKLVVEPQQPFLIKYSNGRRKEFPIRVFITHFLKEWFNIIAVFNTKDVFKHWYINITTPAKYDGKIISYKDLLLDLRVYSDYTWDLLDEDEYKEHLDEISSKRQLKIRNTLIKLKKLIRSKSKIFCKNILE